MTEGNKLYTTLQKQRRDSTLIKRNWTDLCMILPVYNMLNSPERVITRLCTVST